MPTEPLQNDQPQKTTTKPAKAKKRKKGGKRGKDTYPRLKEKRAVLMERLQEAEAGYQSEPPTVSEALLKFAKAVGAIFTESTLKHAMKEAGVEWKFRPEGTPPVRVKKAPEAAPKSRRKEKAVTAPPKPRNIITAVIAQVIKLSRVLRVELEPEMHLWVEDSE